MRGEQSKEIYTKDKEVDIMPSLELVEYEKAAYIQEMRDYLQSLRDMPKHEMKKQAHTTLVECEIIQSNGEFTERYRYTRLSTERRGK